MGGAPAAPLPSAGGSELDRIRTIVNSVFPVYDVRVGPQSLVLAVQVERATLEGNFDRLRRQLWAAGYVPILRYQMGEYFVEVVPRPKLGTKRQWVNLLLLAGTVGTTTFAGALIWLTYVGGSTLSGIDFLWGAVYFSIPVLTILGLHELAHFFMARRHRIDASLPYFIPIPPPFLFGTFGAFISIREPFPDKKALFDIGVAGPLVGFAASIPIALVGLFLSMHAPVLPATYCGPTIFGVSYGNLEIGEPLFWLVLSSFFPSGLVSLHPLALAGWVGIFVTAINLLPAGQLDGGHVFRALFGDRVRFVSYGAVILLFALGLFYTGWLFFAILILLLGVRHPPPLNDLSPLDAKRYLVGAFAVAVLLVGFVITPIATPAGAVSLNVGGISYPGSSSQLPVQADVNFTLVNGDLVPHGYTLSASVANVSQDIGGNTVYLTGTGFTDWAANSTWVFVLPDGHNVSLSGGTVSLPSDQYLTLSGSSGHTTAAIVLAFANTGEATSVLIDLSTNQFCAPAGGGSAGTSVLLIPP
ncbi:MAG TPA: site-2 protease family protein [Thermoplasmata archaeon]|nr:site-2 protease family protein [Thermoplasmata archaeon]